MSHKRKLWIISAGVAAAVIITIFTAMFCTVWRPKSKQEWLDIFQNSLAFSKDAMPQKTEKSISITEEGTEVANFYQLVEINEQDGKTVGHIVVEEKYPLQETSVFDIYDEYYFIDKTIYVFRKNGEDEVTTSFSSAWDAFWQIVQENTGAVNYAYNKEIFSDLEITHKNEHSLYAKVLNENLSKFLGDANTENITDLSIGHLLNENLTLKNFNMLYTIDSKKKVTSQIARTTPEYIEIKDFAKG